MNQCAHTVRGVRLRLHRPRGVEFIEFALVLPIMIILILLAVDVGRIVLASGALQDATLSAARNGAQAGSMNSQQAQEYVSNTLQGTLTGLATTPGEGLRVQVLTGNPCQLIGTPGASDSRNVTVQSDSNISLLTPGVAVALQWALGNADPQNTLPLSTTAVARCEVVR